METKNTETLLMRTRMELRDILKRESETLHAQFISIAENLRSSYLSFSTPVFYTSHGIDHCLNIENIINVLIPDYLKAKMNKEEIFILLCSVYLHDVGMALITKDKGYAGTNDYFKQVDEARRTHSEKTASFVLKNYEEFGLRKAQAEVISWICRAHSDIKNPDGTKIYTFAELMDRADVTNIDTVSIRVKYLAALLRLADELDITAKRAPGKQMRVMDLPFESQMEWMKHQIFSGVSIDPKLWEIALDVSEVLLYGHEKEKDKIALTNKLVTDVATKIRESLMEVRPPLQKEGILYKKIRFRDLMIRRLEGIFKNYGINLDGITFLGDIEDDATYGGYTQEFLYEIEKLELSPEYCVSKTIDDRLFQSVNFFLNFENNLLSTGGVIEGKDEEIKKIQNSIVKFLRRYVRRRGPRKKETYEDEKEEYLAHIDSIGRYIFERGILREFNTELKYEITEAIENENAFKKEIDDSNLFTEMVITDIIKDLLLHQRRKVMLDKLDLHYYFHIIPKSYFYSIINPSAQEPLGRGNWMRAFRRTLSYLKNLMDKSDGRFKLFYHTNDIDLDYRIITSEVVLLPGRKPLSHVVITEMEAVIQFYEDFHNVLRSSETWFIEDIDTKNFQIKLGRDEKFQGKYTKKLAQREKIERELNTIISTIIN